MYLRLICELVNMNSIIYKTIANMIVCKCTLSALSKVQLEMYVTQGITALSIFSHEKDTGHLCLLVLFHLCHKRYLSLSDRDMCPGLLVIHHMVLTYSITVNTDNNRVSEPHMIMSILSLKQEGLLSLGTHWLCWHNFEHNRYILKASSVMPA